MFFIAVLFNDLIVVLLNESSQDLSLQTFALHNRRLVFLFHYSALLALLFSVLRSVLLCSPHSSILHSPHFCSSCTLLEGDSYGCRFPSVLLSFRCDFIQFFIPALSVRVEECPFVCHFIWLRFYLCSSRALLKGDFIWLSRKSFVHLP